MIPVAAGIGCKFFMISPMMCSVAMSISSIIVVLCSNMLRLIDFTP